MGKDKKDLPFYKEKIPYLKELGINFTLDNASGVPFYRQIIQIVETNIYAVKLRPGDKLPTVRSLAIELKINPNTVAKAYTELELRGFVITQVGSGTFISDKKVDAGEMELNKKIDETLAAFVNRMKSFGLDKNDMINYIKNYRNDEDV